MPHVQGTLAGSGELEDLRFVNIEVALALDLAVPDALRHRAAARMDGPDETERKAPRRTAVLTRRDWRLE